MRRFVAILALVLAGCSATPPAVAPTPTPFVPPAPVVTDPPISGLGVIQFGSNYDRDTLAIVGQKSRFPRSVKNIAWSAQLSEPAGGNSLTFIIASKSRSGVERTIIRQEVDLSNPESDLLANRVDLALLLNRKPGTYVMRYLREGDLLAEGEFTLVR